MERLRAYIDSPAVWIVAGFAIGIGLGVNTASVWLVAIGLGAFILYLSRHGPAHPSTEGRLFAAGPAFILAWLVGFVVRGIVS